MFAVVNAAVDPVTRAKIDRGAENGHGRVAAKTRSKSSVMCYVSYSMFNKGVTISPAVICGMAGRIGSIQRGKDADLVLWEDDPFDVRSKPQRVWIDGREIDMSIQAFPRWWPAS